MKYFLIALLALASYQAPTDAFISRIIGGVTNVVTGTINAITNTVNAITNTINTLTFIGQFVWDNAFQPALDLFNENLLILIDDYFGGLLNIFGKRSEEIEGISLRKEYVTDLSKSIFQDLIRDITNLFFTYIEELKEYIRASMGRITSGEINFQEVVSSVALRYIEAIEALVQNATNSIINPTKTIGVEQLGIEIAKIYEKAGAAAITCVSLVVSEAITNVFGKEY